MKKIKKIKIKVNGKFKSIPEKYKISDLVKDLKIPLKKVAIELNQEIMDKKKISKIILKKDCLKKSREIGIELEFVQSNIEGELVSIIQDSRKKYNGLIINAAGFTHTSVAIRDALDLFKKPIIELHISNIYKREEFRHKSLISDIATGGIFGLGVEGYILAIISLQKILTNENR